MGMLRSGVSVRLRTENGRSPQPLTTRDSSLQVLTGKLKKELDVVRALPQD